MYVYADEYTLEPPVYEGSVQYVYWPAAHVLQEAAPAAAAVPALQEVQVVAPLAEYLPPVHELHADAPAAENFPAAHTVHVLEAVTAYLPAAQEEREAVQESEPVADTLPEGQGVQDDTVPPLEYEPAAQLAHDEPVTYCPAEHVTA